MNYLLHGYGAIDEPYVLAGTALPDWMRVAGRKIRADFRTSPGEDGSAADISRGVEEHFRADRLFHGSSSFAEVCREASQMLRRKWPLDPRFRASFFAHVLIEILLDAELASRVPRLISDYYESLERVDVRALSEWAERKLKSGGERLANVCRRFRSDRFIERYWEDSGVLGALERVANRVRLPPLPGDFVIAVGRVRALVSERADELFGAAGVVVADLFEG